MVATPLIITSEVAAQLRTLRGLAALNPVDVSTLRHRLSTQTGELQHRAQMREQSITVPGPWPFLVIFSVEYGHPVGVCRHMSMSVQREGRVPSPDAVWTVAELLGFEGGIPDCTCWPEEISAGGVAVNLVQPVIHASDLQA